MDGFSRFLVAELAGTNFGGVGIGIALVLLVALRFLLPVPRRRSLRWPAILLVVYLPIVLLRAAIHDPHDRTYGALGVAGLFVILTCLTQLGFLLVVDVLFGRRRALPRIVTDIARGILFLAVVAATLQSAGVEPGSILTTSALLTAVLGLSLQETLGNLFAGLSMQAQQPFEVGDWIAFDDNADRVGRVIEINWRATKLLTVDDVEIVVPNGVLAKAPIRNFTQPQPFTRLQIVVNVPYDAPPNDVHALLMSCLDGVAGVLTMPPASIVTLDFTERGVQYGLRFYVDDYLRRAPIAGEVRDRAWYALARAGVAMAVPLRETRLVEETVASREAAERAAADARAAVLREVSLFAPLSPQDVALLASKTRIRRYAPAELVIKQGEAGSELFAVVRGGVRVLRARDNEAPLEVARLGEGSVFGEMSLMTGEARSATVRTTDAATELLVVGKDAFRAVLDAHPALAERISEILTERQAALTQADAGELDARQALRAQRKTELLTRIRAFFAL